jgi:hypothetical protein
MAIPLIPGPEILLKFFLKFFLKTIVLKGFSWWACVLLHINLMMDESMENCIPRSVKIP